MSVEWIAELVERSVRAGLLPLLVTVGLGAGLLAPSAAIAGNTVYATDWAEGTVATFTIGAGGVVTQQGTPVDTGTSTASRPSAVALSPSGQTLYVANEGLGTISTFAIGPGGALSLQGSVATDPSTSGSEPYGVAASPSGQNVYVANYGSGTVATFSVGSGGALSLEGTPVTSGAGTSSGPGWLAISPSGQNLYVTNYNEGTVSTFAIGAGGALTQQGTPVASGSTATSAYPERLAISPNGQNLYVTNEGQGTVSAFTVGAGGALTPQGSPVSSGTGAGSQPEGVAISPEGQDLYVTNEGQGTVSTFAIGAGGTLTQQGTPTTSGSSSTSQPFGVTVSPGGQYLYVANFAPGTVSTFSIGAGGVLTPQGIPVTSGSSTSSEPYELVVSPDQGPTATYSATAAPAGSASQFNAQASTGGSAPIETYLWLFGDGGFGSGPLISHIFATPGAHTVILTLIDSDSCSDFGPFTGHTAYCAPDTAATISQTVNVPVLATASHYSLSGVAEREPKLAFTVTAGQSIAPLHSVEVTLPIGLTFSRVRKNIADGITVRGANGRGVKFAAKVRRRVLTLTLRAATRQAQVTIMTPELSVSESLADKVRSSRHGRARRDVRLTVPLEVKDTHDQSAALSPKLRVN